MRRYTINLAAEDGLGGRKASSQSFQLETCEGPHRLSGRSAGLLCDSVPGHISPGPFGALLREPSSHILSWISQPETLPRSVRPHGHPQATSPRGAHGPTSHISPGTSRHQGGPWALKQSTIHKGFAYLLK